MNLPRSTTVAAMIAATAITIAATACGGDEALPTPRAPATGTVLAASPSATATAPPTSGTPLVAVTGIFTDPRATHIDDERSLGPDPAPPAWDPGHNIVVDTVSGRTFDLFDAAGAKAFGYAFDPSSRLLVWTTFDEHDAPEVRIMDLADGTTRVLASGGLGDPPFVDADHVYLRDGAIDESVDLSTGQRRPLAAPPTRPDIAQETTPDGYVITHAYVPADAPPRATTLTDPRTNAVVMQIDAYDVRPAGRGAVVVATRPQPASTGVPARGTSNIFLVDVVSGEATFVATAAFAGDLPFAANDDFVVWTDGACDGGTARIYDRRTGRITRLDQPLWSPTFTPAGNIVEGFLLRRVIDPRALTVLAAMPVQAPPHWSPDYRYVALIGVRGDSHGPCMYF